MALLLLAPASCVSGPRPTAPTAGLPMPAGRDPEIRVGLVVGAGSVGVGGGAALAVTAPDGSHLWMIPPGETWHAAVAGNGFTLGSRGWTSAPLEAVTLTPVESNPLVRVNGRSYRGSVVILRGGTGITVVNRVGLESYLLGVVSAEMGRRGPAEQAALRAQAVVSRTYALRNLGRWKAQGFDLAATVAAQVYSGQGAETPEGHAAVRDTRGRVLTYEGALIEAFFYSTCGGRTADGFEVFRGAARPYLRSIPDQADNGSVYCSISPRYRWHEEWTGEALQSTLQRNLPPVAGARSVDVREVSNVRVTRRSSSGRVDQLAIELGGPEIRVEGPEIRQVMRLSSGEPLRSTAFDLVATVAGHRVTHLAVDGMGSGHGVGFCQWGAVGRARAGQGYEQILAAYFPRTRLERRY
ncbi:MAG TPA: SpoIID/LytB domain-containing protein [Gemmatimonadales bacterium]|nr:SpoIID/LytB domain-containing protein [Gemmatimonadales bacterium]